MIDYVKIKYNIDIPDNYFSEQKWKLSQTDDNQPFYWHTTRGVKLRYYPHTRLFTISGKIIMMLYDTQVQNVDDIYGANKEWFINDINRAINRLFPDPILDIREFSVTQIDYCVNVETPYVGEYITFLSKACQMANKDSRIDYAVENGFAGSVYVRTASDYRTNQNKNYTLNFYDKTARLEYLREKGTRVSQADTALAKDQLRLEVQCGYQMIKRLARKFNTGTTFGELFDFKIAYEAIFSVYALVFKGNYKADYYTYAEAKKLLKGNDAAKKIIYVATSHKILDDKYAYGRTQAKKLGVYPFCFLDKKGNMPRLDNPIKLLRKKLVSCGALME
jgi:hypothetical protein